MKILFPFCNYQLGKVLFHYVYLFSLFHSLQSYLFWFAEFAGKLIDTTASRLARHFLRNKEKMAWTFVLSGYVRRVAKRHSTCLRLLLKSDRQHADNKDEVIPKGKSHIRVLLSMVCHAIREKSKIGLNRIINRGQILKRQCTNCTLYCWFLLKITHGWQKRYLILLRGNLSFGTTNGIR